MENLIFKLSKWFADNPVRVFIILFIFASIVGSMDCASTGKGGC